MKKTVLIREKTSGKNIAIYKLVIDSLTESDKDVRYFNEAWSCALEDGLVIDGERSDYNFSIEN